MRACRSGWTTSPGSGCTADNLAELVAESSVVGVTTNPTIFASALAKGEAYDAQMEELAARDSSVEDAIKALTTDDVRNACDVLAATSAASHGVDGRVSIEVEPGLARDADATIAQAKDLWKIVDRPNLLIKIPATLAGIPAITAVIGEGISVNVTLIFSLQRYGAVIDAYLSGLEQAAANGHDLTQIHSVASFFVSRVDTEVRQAARRDRHRRGHRAEEQGRHRQRPAGVRALREDVRRRPLGGAGRPGREQAAAAVGLDRGEGPGAARHSVRHRARRGRHRQHDAGEDDAGLRRPRRGGG